MTVNGEPLEPIGAGAAHFDLVDGDEPIHLVEQPSDEARLYASDLVVRAAVLVLEDNYDSTAVRNKLAVKILKLIVP